MSSDDTFDNIAVNVMIHCLILFVFLSCFFYFYISKIVSEHISDEIVSFAKDIIDSKYDDMDIRDRARFSATLQTMPLATIKKMYSKPDPVKIENNFYNKFSAVLIACGMFAVLLAMFFTYRFRCNRQIHGTHLIVENAIVFICVMALELGFFVLVASKFVPVVPSSTIKDIVKRIKTNFATPQEAFRHQ